MMTIHTSRNMWPQIETKTEHKMAVLTVHWMS